jgi:hypothetical protein
MQTMQTGYKKSDKCYSWIWSDVLEESSPGYYIKCTKRGIRAGSRAEGQCLYEYKIIICLKWRSTMKLIDNIEFSHAKEVVISHKVFYVKDDADNYVRDDERTAPTSIENNVMPDYMSANDMAEYVRDYIGVKRWKIVLSSGTINIFKKKKRVNHKIIEEVKKPAKVKKTKKSKVNQNG